MSDNITREPYRNAWYKQLSDAVKKHDEEIAEMRPHLVPDVEEGDNGKILIAGEEGAFDWGQPPEELPIITEGDEGKVLKVDEGLPKWLEDKDAEIPSHTASDEGKMLSVNAQNALEWKDVPDEIPTHTASDEGKMLSVNNQNGLEWKDVPDEIPVHTASDDGKMLSVNNQNGLEWKDVPKEAFIVTITRSGTNPNYVYSADKTYSEIKSAVESGRVCVAYFDNVPYFSYITNNNRIDFIAQIGFNTINLAVDRSGEGDYGFVQGLQFNRITVYNDNTVTRQNVVVFVDSGFNLAYNDYVNVNTYNALVASTRSNTACFGKLTINNKLYFFIKSSSSSETEFTLYNYELGLKATVDSNKYCTITEIPKLPAPPSTDGTYTLQCVVSSGTPTYSWV